VRTRMRRWLPVVLGAIALILAVFAIAKDGHQIADAVRDIGPRALVGSAVAAFVGVAFTALLWWQVLAGLDAPVPLRTAARVFFPSQLGKYLPGALWPVVAQMEFGRRRGINRRRMLSANALMLVISLAVGLVVAAACLPTTSAEALRRYWWTFAFLPLLVLLLVPRVVPGVVDWIFGKLGREPLEARLPVAASLRASGWSLLGWLGLGVHVYLLARPFGASGAQALLAALGGTALAVCAGTLFIPAPAGAGVRDAVLILTLTPGIGTTHAIAVALLSRATLIVVDLLIAGLALLVPDLAAQDVAIDDRANRVGDQPDRHPDDHAHEGL
jgi:glycosyltransferase 2 family protein